MGKTIIILYGMYRLYGTTIYTCTYISKETCFTTAYGNTCVEFTYKVNAHVNKYFKIRFHNSLFDRESHTKVEFAHTEIVFIISPGVA